MVYIFRVYALVTVVVFGLAGIVLLFLVAWNQVKAYAMARRAPRERANLDISRAA